MFRLGAGFLGFGCWVCNKGFVVDSEGLGFRVLVCFGWRIVFHGAPATEP